MAIDIGGVTYYPYAAQASWDPDASRPLPNAAAVVEALDGTPLVVRDPETQAVITPISDQFGIWAPALVNALESNWSSGGSAPQPRFSTDVLVLASASVAAQTAAEAAQTAAEAAQAAAEAAEGPAGPAGSPYPILTYDTVGTTWPARPVGETGPVVWFLPVTESTWPGDPAGVTADDLLDVPSGVDPTA